jgi:cytosolic carboxypeptidase protein 5
MLPKLMSLNSVNFDFTECSFNDADNNKKDLKGDSREGSGRAAVFKMTGLPYCYTMEGNYATGLRINTLQCRVQDGKKILKEDF